MAERILADADVADVEPVAAVTEEVADTEKTES